MKLLILILIAFLWSCSYSDTKNNTTKVINDSSTLTNIEIAQFYKFFPENTADTFHIFTDSSFKVRKTIFSRIKLSDCVEMYISEDKNSAFTDYLIKGKIFNAKSKKMIDSIDLASMMLDFGGGL